MPEKPCVRTFMDGQHVKGPKDCLNLHGSILVKFFDHSESKSAQKILF